MLAQATKAITDFREKGALTLHRAMQGKQISYYRRQCGDVQLCITITAWVLSLANAFNLSANLEEEQAEEIASTIIRERWDLKLAELGYFFDKAKQGVYGKIFNRLDIGVIFEWLQVYEKERQSYFESKHDIKKNKGDSTEEGLAIVAALRERFPDQYKANYTGKSLREMCQEPEFKAWQAEQYKKEIEGQRDGGNNDPH